MTEPPRTEDIAALIAEFEASDLHELHLRAGGIELFLSKDRHATAAAGEAAPGASPPPPAAPPAPASEPAPSPAAAELPEGHAIVRAPYLGHFYRAPKPGEPNFVEIGDMVEVGRDLCLVEVMKLFTAVRAETAGVVAHVFATDGEMVAEGQPLFALRPQA